LRPEGIYHLARSVFLGGARFFLLPQLPQLADNPFVPGTKRPGLFEQFLTGTTKHFLSVHEFSYFRRNVEFVDHDLIDLISLIQTLPDASGCGVQRVTVSICTIKARESV